MTVKVTVVVVAVMVIMIDDDEVLLHSWLRPDGTI